MERTRWAIMLAAVAIGGAAQSARSSDQVGTVTLVMGEVKLFSHPSKKKPEGPPPHGLFEGEHYSVQDAKAGDRVQRGGILRTSPTGRAKVVFDNGDQFYVHPGTAYRVSWGKDSAKGAPNVNLMHGRIRGVVEKGGPRSRLTIKTKAATMGVRGTDFFVAEGGVDGGTEVTVLRGKVEVKPAALSAKKEVKKVEIVTGQTAEVAAPVRSEASKKPPSVEVTQTTQQSLAAIQKSAEAIAAAPALKEAQPAPVPEKVRELEERALKTTLEDIRKADPKLHAQMQASPPQSVGDLNRRAVEVLIPTAPKAPEKHKPRRTELEDLGGDAYDKYFKIGE